MARRSTTPAKTIVTKMISPPLTLDLPIPTFPPPPPSHHPFHPSLPATKSHPDSGTMSLEAAQILHDALAIRHHVFCDEQGCSAANEVDEDDGRSWHWVAYSSTSDPHDSTTSTSTFSSSLTTMKASSVSTSPSPSLSSPSTSSLNTNGSARSNQTPLACLRLVPPPHPPHPHPDPSSSTTTITATGSPSNYLPDRDYVPYLKVGRMAVLPQARRGGLARSLCETALAWARTNPAAILRPDTGADEGKNRGDQNENDKKARENEEEERKDQERWQGWVLVHAQVSVRDMWARLGFVADDTLGNWYEEGIPHLGMWRRLRLESEGDERAELEPAGDLET